MLLVKLKWVEHEIRGIAAETIWMTSEVGCVCDLPEVGVEDACEP